MKYRQEIDGLRALAILPVVFFHAGIQSLAEALSALIFFLSSAAI